MVRLCIEREVLFCLLMMASYSFKEGEGFTATSKRRISRGEHRRIQILQTAVTSTTVCAIGDLFEDVTTAADEDQPLQQAPMSTKEPSVSVLDDANGNIFTVGCTVRVCKADLHMYQVGAKATGSYDENDTFVPNPSQRYLVLPVGLRGTVTKVYMNSENNLSANFPIRVEFRPTAEGEKEPELDPPARFTAHFATNEVEYVA